MLSGRGHVMTEGRSARSLALARGVRSNAALAAVPSRRCSGRGVRSVAGLLSHGTNLAVALTGAGRRYRRRRSRSPVVRRRGPLTHLAGAGPSVGWAHGSSSRPRRSPVNRVSRAAMRLLLPTPQGQTMSEDGSQQVAVERLPPMVQRVDRGGSRQIVRSRFPVARPAEEVTGALDYDGSGAGEHPDPEGSP
jgi:hypothetical protein